MEEVLDSLTVASCVGGHIRNSAGVACTRGHQVGIDVLADAFCRLANASLQCSTLCGSAVSSAALLPQLFLVQSILWSVVKSLDTSAIPSSWKRQRRGEISKD